MYVCECVILSSSHTCFLFSYFQRVAVRIFSPSVLQTTTKAAFSIETLRVLLYRQVILQVSDKKCFYKICSGTGKNGQSIWKQKFKDEFDEALKVFLNFDFTFFHSIMPEALFLWQTMDRIPMDHNFLSHIRSRTCWI